MHHGDAAYDTNDSGLSPQQKRILEFSPYWFNEQLREDKQASLEQNPALTRLHPLACAESDSSLLLPGLAPPRIAIAEKPRGY